MLSVEMLYIRYITLSKIEEVGVAPVQNMD